MSGSAATFAAVFATLFAAHQVADHWVQTEWQAATKGEPGSEGAIACTWHVLTYTATAVVFLSLLDLCTDTNLGAGAVPGLVVSAVTHWIADRRAPLRWMAERAGHARFHQLGALRPGRDDNPSLGTGAYALDQSWHYGWLFVAALIMTWR